MSAEDLEYTAGLERLHAVLAAEQLRHGELFPPAEEGPASAQGTHRTHDEMEGEGPVNASLLPNVSAPYTLEEGRAYKRSRNLSPQADAEAEAFLQSPNPFHQAFQTHVAVLEIRDYMARIAAENTTRYQVPDILEQKTCHDMAHLAIVSPNAFKYRDSSDGNSIAHNILAAMRLLNTADLPPVNETGRVAMVITCINKGLTDWRCHVKSAVWATLPDVSSADKENRGGQDIATLTRACIASTPAKATAILYQRIALIRECACKCVEGKKNEKKFWQQVDIELALRRKVGTAPETAQILAEATYENDKKIYGIPDAAIPLTTLVKLHAWLDQVDNCLATA
ncbi:hypothetical protein C8J57DRAFT_1457161 [Mycena rebaudengoi]|nr:hypothetical protein C8J57DRAFT_1457161 [Mycena rebaudengoi]